jgi:hypothetical protein
MTWHELRAGLELGLAVSSVIQAMAGLICMVYVVVEWWLHQ